MQYKCNMYDVVNCNFGLVSTKYALFVDRSARTITRAAFTSLPQKPKWQC